MKLSLRLIQYKPLFYKLLTLFLVIGYLALFIKLSLVLIKTIVTLTMFSIFAGVALLLLAIITSFFIFVTLVHCGKKLKSFNEIHQNQEEV